MVNLSMLSWGLGFPACPVAGSLVIHADAGNHRAGNRGTHVVRFPRFSGHHPKVR